MSVSAGSIIVELGIDDSGMPVVIRRAGAVLREFQTTLNQTTSSVKKLEDAHSSLSTKFRHLVMTMGNLRFVAMDINDIFLRLPVSILKTAGEMERLQILMTGLSKETNKAAKEAEGLKDFKFVSNMSKTAPFEIAALADTFVKLKTAGIDPTKGSMNALVDSVARFGGSSDVLKRASIAIQQMTGKGVISMEELRQQLGEAVPTAMQNMADGMGVSMQKLAKIVQTGTLAAGPALERMFFQMQVENKGAAEEMMKTWGGMLSRLKTEWDLTSKFIADSGFGKAAKDSVLELTDALQSREFKSFASDLGASMGSAVKILLGAGKAAVEFRDQIMFMVEAWIAYKLAFSVIPGMSKSVVDGYNAVALRMATERADILKNQAAKVTYLATQEAEAIARRELTAMTLNDYRMEMEAAQMKNAFIAASEAKLAQSIMMSRGGVQMAGYAQLQTQAVAGAELQRLGAATAAMTVRQAELAANTVIVAETLALQSAASAEATLAVAKLAAATKLQTAGTTAAMAASRGMSVLLAALGGPVGIAIIAIMGLVYAWNKVSGAADEAYQRQRRAAMGTTDADEQVLNVKGLEVAVRRRNALLDLAAAHTPEQKTPDFLKEENARILAANANVAKLEEVVKQGAANVMEAATSDQVTGIRLSVKRVIEARELAFTEEQASVKTASEKKLAVLRAAGKGESKEYQKIVNERVDEIRRIELNSLLVRSKSEDAAAVAAANFAKTPGISDAERAASLQVFKEMQEASATHFEQSQKKYADLAYDEKKGKGAGGGAASSPGNNKLQDFLDDLKVKKIGMEARLKGLLELGHKADEVAAAVAEYREKIATGQMDITDPGKGQEPHKPSKLQQADGEKQVADFKETELLLENTKKLSAEIVKMGPDLEHAKKIMANPFGTPDQKKSNRADEILATLKITPKQLEEMNNSLDPQVMKFVALMKELQAGASAIDTADATKKVIEDTKNLVDSNQKATAELIMDSRVRAAELYRIGEEAIRLQNEQRLARERLNNADTKALEAAMAEAAAIRKKAFEKNASTPMDRLVSDWKQSLDKMDEASARWAGSFVDMIVSSAQTGKLEFSKLVQSILADILKIQLQRTLGDPLKNMIEGGVKWTQSKLPDLGTNGADAAAKVASDLLLSNKGLKIATDAAKEGLATMTSSGTTEATKALIEGSLVTGQETSSSMTFTSSLNLANAALSQFTAMLQASSGSSSSSGVLSSLFGGSTGAAGDTISASYGSDMTGFENLFGFANGGIMTSMGSVSLRKYAAGGIANSPQLAMYGEAGPEAYVPLPDGRSIPVTMSGSTQAAAAPQVTVNVINQSGQQVNSQQGQTRFDGKQMVLDIVLTAVNQPGSFRSGMKGALA